MRRDVPNAYRSTLPPDASTSSDPNHNRGCGICGRGSVQIHGKFTILKPGCNPRVIVFSAIEVEQTTGNAVGPAPETGYGFPGFPDIHGNASSVSVLSPKQNSRAQRYRSVAREVVCRCHADRRERSESRRARIVSQFGESNTAQAGLLRGHCFRIALTLQFSQELLACESFAIAQEIEERIL